MTFFFIDGGTLIAVGTLSGELALWRLPAEGSHVLDDDGDPPRFWDEAGVVRWLREYVTRAPGTINVYLHATTCLTGSKYLMALSWPFLKTSNHMKIWFCSPYTASLHDISLQLSKLPTYISPLHRAHIMGYGSNRYLRSLFIFR